MTRITMAWLPRCTNMLTRNRHSPGIAVGNVARALFSQRRQCLLVAADQFFGDTAGIFGAKQR